MPQRFWNVYNYIARQWYDTEYGQVEDADRWYHPAMLFLERVAMGLPPQRKYAECYHWTARRRS